MKPRYISMPLLLIALVVPAQIATAQVGTCSGGDNYNCFLLRANPGSAATIATAHGLTVLGQLDANTPDVLLVNGPALQDPAITLADVLADPDAIVFEALVDAAITESLSGADLDQSYGAIVDTLGKNGNHTGPLQQEFTAPVWNGYAEQPLADLAKLHEAHAFKDNDKEDDAPLGWGVIAVIDTGVDPDHPMLLDALVPGYDFILDQAGASEWSALDPTEGSQADFQAVADQSYGAIVDGGGDVVFKNPSTAVVLDQSYGAIVDTEPVPSAFGHGTMVAGVIRLIAPGAQIMPLRVFDGSGGANVFAIARAIRFAVDNGAHVINMSFSTPVMSEELMRAVNYAHRNGVVCVAAAGNAGGASMRYPAGFGTALGVASTDDLDTMSGFSNYGPDLVHLAAPGEGFMTAYPGGLFAAAWGTSFSTAVVSGTVALLHHVERNGQKWDYYPTDYSGAAYSFRKGVVNSTASDDWGYGRLDILEAVKNKVKGGTSNGV